MALVRHLLNNFSAVITRAPLFTSQGVGHLCASLCTPFSLRSHVACPITLIKQLHTVDEKQSSLDVEKEKQVTLDIISNVNQQIQTRSHGRLFAVVHVCGKQFKVTTEDLIVIEGYWAPSVGDKLKLEKILLIGGCDFTLFGRPILPPDQASVEATVIEKTMSHTKTIFKKKKRKQYMRINFHRSEYTFLRINSIELTDNVNVRKDVEGLERIF